MNWRDTADFSKLKDITQAYAVIFDEQGRIVLVTTSNGSGWTLPGGKPEPNESFEETVKREVMEEANVSIENITPLGYVEVKPDEGKEFQQLRFAATIKKIFEQKKDPANGILRQRVFVDPKNFNAYAHWSVIGMHIITKAVAWHDSLKKNRP